MAGYWYREHGELIQNRSTSSYNVVYLADHGYAIPYVVRACDERLVVFEHS
jgi:hypothetical protein